MDGQPSDAAARFNEAIRRFDAENAQDPNREVFDGREQPRELLYAQWLTSWVLKLAPGASEPLRLAARCQHLCRWLLPRSSFPATRAGYLHWRQQLKKLHAEKAGGILRASGYSEEVVQRVQALNLKQNFPDDPESRILEDALCLVFLEHQFEQLAAKTADDKMIEILQKTWKKMSPNAHGIAGTLVYGPHEQDLLNRALQQTGR
jgi:hypothetical protein